MLTFSIDYLTGNDQITIPRKRMDSVGNNIPPTVSLCSNTVYAGSSTNGLAILPSAGSASTGHESESAMSLSDSDNFNLDSTESIAKVLLSLDQRSINVHKGEDTIRPSPSTSPNNGDQKPPHSYIALISMAILSSSDEKMLLGDIYQYIMDKFSYYNNRERAWRNSIRHNLSLNECFIKNGRADNGKGNFWSIHPACVEDFAKGDYRRRQARRRARKTTKDTNMATMPQGFGCNIGYVPMTSSSMGHYPYQSLTPQMVRLGPQVQGTGTIPSQGYQSHFGMAPEMMTWGPQFQNMIPSSPQRFYSGHMVYPQIFSQPIPYPSSRNILSS